MSNHNPEKALAALLPLPITIDNTIEVKPLTLGLYAALEKINSPLLTGAVSKVDALIPSLYLLTHNAREVLNSDLPQKAYDWADTISVNQLDAIRLATYRQINAALGIIPEADEDGPKKKRMDG